MTSHHVDLSNKIRLYSEDQDPFNAKLKKKTKATCPACIKSILTDRLGQVPSESNTKDEHRFSHF